MKDEATKPEAPGSKPSDGERKGRRWVLPPNVKDVTAQQRGKLFAIVGVPVPKPAKGAFPPVFVHWPEMR